VKGRDVEQQENFRAALETGYPGEVETIFVFEDRDDPGHRVAEAAISAYERGGGTGTARIVLAGPPPPDRTGKISNMIAGAAAATGELIAFGDSDTRPDREVLGNLVEHLVQDERIGAVFAPAALTSRPRTPGDVGHAMILNVNFRAEAEFQCGAGRELPFLIGNLMVFRRSALDAIGGIECADGQLVDDMYLGARVVEAGYRNVMGTHLLSLIGHGLGFGEFARMWRRWLFFGRAGMSSSFVLPILVRVVGYFLAVGLTIAALAIGPPSLALAPGLVWICEGVHQLRLNRLTGGPRVPATCAWMAWGPYLMALPILVSMLVYPKLRWRGRVYRVGYDTKLERS
jgi:ceramide glucosyltransferase